MEQPNAFLGTIFHCKCSICGILLSNVDYPELEEARSSLACDRCLLIEIKKREHLVKFLDAQSKETDDVDKCVTLQGIRLKKMTKKA
jgi:hypothetical protein